MSRARAAAEIEPAEAIRSRRAILPGPIRPSGSMSMRRLSDAIGLSFVGAPNAPPAVVTNDRAACRAPRSAWGERVIVEEAFQQSTRSSRDPSANRLGRHDSAGHRARVEGDGLDHGEGMAVDGEPQSFQRLAGDARHQRLAAAVEMDVGE